MRDAVLKELQFSVAIVLSREEVVPRFEVFGSDGAWTIFVPLPNAIKERERRLRLVAGFMAWTSATHFILSGELVEPDFVYPAAIARTSVLMAGRMILRKPLSVEPIEWLPENAAGDEIPAMLPRGRVTLDANTEQALIAAFGERGEFKAERRHS